ncbi:hypothetical protein TNCV_3353151 [Trichonephila clavipes]|nr:hypothetical protein TNCV_3353151 [Trichonephila clavipes]
MNHAVAMDDYWALLGCLALITNKIAKIQKNFVMYTESEFSQVKRALKKELKNVEKACSAFVPVLADSRCASEGAVVIAYTGVVLNLPKMLVCSELVASIDLQAFDRGQIVGVGSFNFRAGNFKVDSVKNTWMVD